MSTTSHLSLKEYFDQHFGLKIVEKRSKSPSATLNAQVRKGKTSKTQTRPCSSGRNDTSKKGLAPEARKKESYTRLKTDTVKKKPSSLKTLSKEDGVRGIREKPGKMGKTSTIFKDKGNVEEVQSRDESVGIDDLVKCKHGDNMNAVDNRFSEGAELVDNMDYVVNEDIQATTSDTNLTLESGDKLEPFSRTKFIPWFGQRPIHRDDDYESLYCGSCQGTSIIIDRPIPFLKVQFNEPM